MEDPASRKVVKIPILAMGKGDFITPMSFQGLENVSLISQNINTKVLYLRLQDYFKYFSVSPYLGLSKKSWKIKNENQIGLEMYSILQNRQLKKNLHSAIQSLKNNYQFPP